ncbi:AP endonuclease [Pleomassaria siparia CBS 279.74]|uniref:Apurinic-apyrimidinic endonuclease 1 n=1 Tax=Pleomassaria siparia CBS 279.74 TaxID=1314801 RepID=A0A6G1KG66_9PLEO|nr:AP endonuclease [Pleomassaria siparia CBS 279.74]
MAKKLAATQSDSSSPSSSENLQGSTASQVPSKAKGESKKRKAPTQDEDNDEKPKLRNRATKKSKVEATQDGQTTFVAAKKATSTRVTAKDLDLAPLQERTQDSNLRVGAHVSTAGGVQNAIPNLLHIGANAFAMFLKNQRKWTNAPLDSKLATLFVDGCKKHNIDVGSCCLPHGSYLVNLAHPEETRKKQAYGSFLDDLTRCHTLGIKLYNFHPGNSNASTREDGIKNIAENINCAHKDPATGEVIPVLETMASLGNTIGGTFKDIADIIKLVENKDRIGVCIDTCHIFAAGYDVRTPEAYAATMQDFDNIIGLKYLKALHVNDSKALLQSCRDLHARIGTGYLGLRAFHNIVNDQRLHGLPMVLETPIDIMRDGKKVEDKAIWAREIKLLEKLVGMDVESEEFKTLEKDLYEEGLSERERVGDQVDRKKKKDAAEKVPRKKKSKKEAKKKFKENVDEEDEDEEEEE